jgi:hypothetical protein
MMKQNIFARTRSAIYLYIFTVSGAVQCRPTIVDFKNKILNFLMSFHTKTDTGMTNITLVFHQMHPCER